MKATRLKPKQSRKKSTNGRPRPMYKNTRSQGRGKGMVITGKGKRTTGKGKV